MYVTDFLLYATIVSFIFRFHQSLLLLSAIIKINKLVLYLQDICSLITQCGITNLYYSTLNTYYLINSPIFGLYVKKNYIYYIDLRKRLKNKINVWMRVLCLNNIIQTKITVPEQFMKLEQPSQKRQAMDTWWFYQNKVIVILHKNN